jgi:hypothetical protein
MERIKSLNNNQDIEDKLEALKNKFKKPWKSFALAETTPSMPRKWTRPYLLSPCTF